MIFNENFYYAIILGVISLVIIIILIFSLFKKPKKNYFDPDELKEVKAKIKKSKSKKMKLKKGNKEDNNKGTKDYSQPPLSQSYGPITAPSRPHRRF